MAGSHDVPDSFDYDVLADVSQHGASVFDFLQPNMFGPAGLSVHHMHSPNFSSPLGHSRPPLDHPMTSLSLVQSVSHSVPDVPMHLHSEAPSAQMPSISTIPNDVTMSPPSSAVKDQKNGATAPSVKTATPGKETRVGGSAKTDKKADKKSTKVNSSDQQGPFGAAAQMPNHSDSFCTTDTVVKPSLGVAVPIAKSERRSRSTRSDPAKSTRMDASADGNGSFSASVDGNALHSPSAVDELEPGKDVHNSHTRRCRAKVNNKFQELLRILPKPPPKTGVKHKAQILDYTIRVFREIYAKKLHLEAELALSSKAQLNTWVDSIVRPASQLADILNPFMSLICTKEKWQFAETWVPSEPATAKGRKNGTLSLESANPDTRFEAGQSVSVLPWLSFNARASQSSY